MNEAAIFATGFGTALLLSALPIVNQRATIVRLRALSEKRAENLQSMFRWAHKNQKERDQLAAEVEALRDGE